MMMRIQPPSERQVEQLANMVHEHPLPPMNADVILATERLDHFEDAFLAMLHQLVRLRGSRPDIALTADQLANINAPTLLVFAADDPMGGAPIRKQVADVMPDAELHVVAGGHAPWIHHADQISPLVTTFINRVSLTAPH